MKRELKREDTRLDSQIREQCYWSRLKGEHLTREEEIAAWERGDTDALIRSQIEWVLKLSNAACRKFDFNDIEICMAAGMAAVFTSLKDFDPRTSRLTTWVTRPVKWRIESAIASHTDRIIRKGDTVISIYQEIGDSGSTIADTLAWREPDTKAVEHMMEELDVLEECDRYFIERYVYHRSMVPLCREFKINLAACVKRLNRIKGALRAEVTSA